MRNTQQLSITLPVEMARAVKSKVASGAYASESEVIREGLRALQERDAALEQWALKEAAAAYDLHRADPTRTTPLADVAGRLDSYMKDRRGTGE